MSGPRVARLPGFLHHFPGIVVRVDSGGRVVESNGVLDEFGDRPIPGREFHEVLDTTSRPKWHALLQREPDWEVTELVLENERGPSQPRRFSFISDPPDTWLVEHPISPREQEVAREVAETTSELVTTQRALWKEKARVEAQLAEVERLSQELRARNAELHTLTEELERSNYELDQFAHIVSHDLKAPLRNLASYAEWIQADLGDVVSGETREMLERFGALVSHLSGLIDGILRYARATRGESAPEEVDVAAAIRGVLDLIGPDSSRTVKVEVDPALGVVRTERALLEQVLLNLLSNALRYARSEVRVTASRCEGALELAVGDDGPGVPEPLRERIWHLFQTTDAARGGTGVGLPLVRKLAEAKGGRAWLDEASEATTFRVLWPLASAPDS